MTPVPAATCTGVILAGGQASRFGGRPKGLESRSGQTRHRPRAPDALRDALPEASVSCCSSPTIPPRARWLPGVPAVADVRPGLGSLGGLLTALTAPGDPVLVVAWDMPFVPGGLAARAPRWRRESGPYDAVVPSSESRRGVEPLCAYYTPACAAPIERRLDAGDCRMIGFLDGRPRAPPRPGRGAPIRRSGPHFPQHQRAGRPHHRRGLDGRHRRIGITGVPGHCRRDVRAIASTVHRWDSVPRIDRPNTRARRRARARRQNRQPVRVRRHRARHCLRAFDRSAGGRPRSGRHGAATASRPARRPACGDRLHARRSSLPQCVLGRAHRRSRAQRYALQPERRQAIPPRLEHEDRDGARSRWLSSGPTSGSARRLPRAAPCATACCTAISSSSAAVTRRSATT